MRTGYEKGYNVYTITDCTAATSLEEQEAAIKFTYPMFSRPMEHRKFLESVDTETEVLETRRGY